MALWSCQSVSGSLCGTPVATGRARPYTCTADVTVERADGSRYSRRKILPKSLHECRDTEGTVPVSTTHGYRYWVMVSRDDPMDFVFVPGPCLKVRETQSAIVYGLAAVAGLTGLALVARGVRRFRRRATAGA